MRQSRLWRGSVPVQLLTLSAAAVAFRLGGCTLELAFSGCSRLRQSLATATKDHGEARRARAFRAAAAGSEEGGGETAERDWRGFRAALISAEGAGSDAASPAASSISTLGGSWAHYAPTVEVGTVLLAAAGFFALQRPELHKAIAVVLRHRPGGEQKSVAIVVNRPDASKQGPGFSGLGMQRWRLVSRWHPDASSDDVEAHDEIVDVMPDLLAVAGHGVLPRKAEVLVDCVGELVWPSASSLQADVERGAWLPAAANVEALRHALAARPEPKAGIKARQVDLGMPAWMRLTHMVSSFRGAHMTEPPMAAESRLDDIGDRLLAQWSQERWGSPSPGKAMPKLFPSASGSGSKPWPSDLSVGSLILTGAHRFAAGVRQYLHKAVLLVVAIDGDHVVTVCLNRPAAGRSSSSLSQAGVQPEQTGFVRTSGVLPSAWPRAAQASKRNLPRDAVVHYGGTDDWSHWTCLVASGPGCPPVLGGAMAASLVEPLGDSGLWKFRDAARAWHWLRLAGSGSQDAEPPCALQRTQANLFARGTTRLALLDLELQHQRGEVGFVTEWTPEMRDIVVACAQYRGPQAQGVRLGLYGDHHGFGLWERAVSHAFHAGDDHAATEVRGVVGDQALNEWAASHVDSDIGKPSS